MAARDKTARRSSELPFQLDGRGYFLQLPGGSPGCNVVTATPACDPRA
jgi:hypothetical protein